MPIHFNPFDEAFRCNPYPCYRELQEHDPVHRGLLRAWVVTRHADVAFVLTDERFCSPKHLERIADRNRIFKNRGGNLDALQAASERFYFFLDPPTHTRLRSLTRTLFSPTAVARMLPIMASYTDRLLDELADRGSFDLIDDFAAPLPVFVIASMLGVQDFDLQKLTAWSFELSRILDPLVSLRDYQSMDEIVRGFEACFREFFAVRRAQPADDIISVLLARAQGHDDLQERDLAAICTMLFATGEETTVNLIGNGMLSLQRNPGAMARLRKDPGLIGGAVEELLRFESPVQMTTRICTEDLELAGTQIRAGEEVNLVIGAANRDPAIFAQPGELRLDRRPNPHLAFGGGIHFCVGPGLARAQACVAIPRLLARFPNLRVQVDNLTWRRNIVVRGLQHLRAET